MNNTPILQFPTGDEATLDEWKEQPEAEPIKLSEERDKFLLWEVRRSLLPTVAKLLTSTQRNEHT
jgi:hypothetical protein